MAVAVTEIRQGMSVEIDGTPFTVIEYQHVKMAQRAWVRIKLRNLRTGSTTEKTFNVDEKMERARIERREMQYLYSAEDTYNFMDKETFDQINIASGKLGDAAKYLVEGHDVTIMFFGDEALGVDLPASVVLMVVETGPSFKGDTASGGGKPAKLESGFTIQVPFFIETGERVKVDTRSGKYIERA